MRGVAGCVDAADRGGCNDVRGQAGVLKGQQRAGFVGPVRPAPGEHSGDAPGEAFPHTGSPGLFHLRAKGGARLSQPGLYFAGRHSGRQYAPGAGGKSNVAHKDKSGPGSLCQGCRSGVMSKMKSPAEKDRARGAGSV